MNSSFIHNFAVFASIVVLLLPSTVFSSDETKTKCLNDASCDEVKVLQVRQRRAERPRCKNITLTKDQFNALDDDSLHVPALNQTFDRWINIPKNETVKICVPFTEEFYSCQRWVLNSNEFEIRDGGLRLWVPDYNRVYETGEFYLKREKEAVVCMEINESTVQEKNEMLLPMGVTWALSAVSLVAALPLCLIFVRTSYRFLLPFYMINLFIGYVILLRRAIGPVSTPKECGIFGVLLQFSLLSAFFWLSIVAFHIWKSVTRIQQGLEPTLKILHLFGYASFSWGIPLFISLISYLIDSGELFPEADWLRPEFQANCWFGARLPTLLFFYIPMGIVLTANIVFFILSIINIRDATKYYSCKPVASKKKLVGTALYLMVIMGLCWTMEALSWAIGGNPRFWYFTDLLNSLQGFFVLLVVIADTRLLSKIPYFRKHDENQSISSSGTDVSSVSCDEKATSSEKK